MAGSVKLTDNSKEVLRGMGKAKERALVRIGEAGKGFAYDLCPEGTPESTGIAGYVGGTLRNSISSAVSGNDAYIGTNVEYAPFVELGTSRMRARPYLKPAATDHNVEYNAIIKQEYENG